MNARKLRPRSTVALCLSLLWLAGCAAPTTQTVPNTEARKAPLPRPKKLFVFLDGTANKWDSHTNVRRLFEFMAAAEDPSRVCFYSVGVGSDSTPLLGGALGYGLKPRVLAGYDFLAKNWQPGDEIYIFGFSRGAHAARALAGIVAHCGIVDVAHLENRSLHSATKQVWDLCRFENEITSRDIWTEAIRTSTPPLANRIAGKRVPVHYADITFLGVWDTVPGSQWKSFGPYGEAEDKKRGLRYKLGAYPPIREIVHAVSIDERRDQFRPVLVPPPIDRDRTTVTEMWFAGAHSDVGGGYDDSNDMAGTSLNWMFEHLHKHHLFAGDQPQVYADPRALQHDTMDMGKWHWLVDPEERWRPADAQFHPSVTERVNAASVKIVRHDGVCETNYAIKPSAPYHSDWPPQPKPAATIGNVKK
jgi:uncharacterized protein (DUF2235 family)